MGALDKFFDDYEAARIKRAGAQGKGLRAKRVREIEREADQILFKTLGRPTAHKDDTAIAAYRKLAREIAWLPDPDGQDVPAIANMKRDLRAVCQRLDELEMKPGTAKVVEVLKRKALDLEAKVLDATERMKVLRTIFR